MNPDDVKQIVLRHALKRANWNASDGFYAEDSEGMGRLRNTAMDALAHHEKIVADLRSALSLRVSFEDSAKAKGGEDE